MNISCSSDSITVARYSFVYYVLVMSKLNEHSELINLVYHDLRRHANALINKEFNGVTFQATELANEVYLKLFNAKNIDWSDTKSFMAAAVVVMRRYLVDHARKKNASKRIPDRLKESLDDVDVFSRSIDDQIIYLDDALNRLEKLDPRQAKVVELRFFAGMNEGETAEVLQLSRRTVSEEWRMAKMWLKHDISSH